MYFGEYQTALDDKGRITVPRAFREVMNVMGHGVWYMTRGFDKSIFLFHREEWDKLRQQMSRFSPMDARALDFRRLFFGSVSQAQPDKQGRMPVPAHLREHGGLDKETVLIGVGDHLELWDRGTWRLFQESKDAEFKEMASRLFAPDDPSALTGNTETPGIQSAHGAD